MFVLICTKNQNHSTWKKTQVLTHNRTHLTTNLLKKRAFFPHLLDVTDKMAVELDPVATRQPTYNALKRVGIVGVEPVVKEIERAPQGGRKYWIFQPILCINGKIKIKKS